jgi:hypothetical protein
MLDRYIGLGVAAITLALSAQAQRSLSVHLFHGSLREMIQFQLKLRSILLKLSRNLWHSNFLR